MTPLEAARRLTEMVYDVVEGGELQPGFVVATTRCRLCGQECGPDFGAHDPGCPADDVPAIVAALETMRDVVLAGPPNSYASDSCDGCSAPIRPYRCVDGVLVPVASLAEHRGSCPWKQQVIALGMEREADELLSRYAAFAPTEY